MPIVIRTPIVIIHGERFDSMSLSPSDEFELVGPEFVIRNKSKPYTIKGRDALMIWQIKGVWSLLLLFDGSFICFFLFLCELWAVFFFEVMEEIDDVAR